MQDIVYAALSAGLESLLEYLSAHVLTCLIPAFFIAGAISALLKKDIILKYFGADAPKWLCYPVAAISGTVLAVCSCTILPMFAGIERKGAGIGPATAFLFSGPAINLMAIVLTARVLGLDIGVARAIAAVTMAVLIGLIMSFVFPGEKERCSPRNPDSKDVSVSRTTLFFIGVLVAILLVATSSAIRAEPRIAILSTLIPVAAYIMWRYYMPLERRAFLGETWWLAKRIFPLLLAGTFLVGVIGYFLPMDLIRIILGSNSFISCLTASVIGAVLYMPTLLEVPIVGTLFGYSSGVTAPGPALALLLAGPSLSLPNMIVIARVIGPRKAGTYIALVVMISTLIGMIYGALVS
ncbi:MAG: permease [Methanothrix sp.]|nr:permease [Methanothrix sp.]MCX8207875.1 permease [Methanothrix sp.]